MIDTALLSELKLELKRLSNNYHPKIKLCPTVMSFGKFKGIPIEQVPSYYLSWCLNNLENLGNLKYIFGEELKKRSRYD